MTCEICVMNTQAVVLAADSAVTSSHPSQKQSRFSKNATKVFQLTESARLAIMIFGSGDFLGIPWQLIVKEFRLKNQKTKFPRLMDAVAAFDTFLSDVPNIFDAELRDIADGSIVFQTMNALKDVMESVSKEEIDEVSESPGAKELSATVEQLFDQTAITTIIEKVKKAAETLIEKSDPSCGIKKISSEDLNRLIKQLTYYTISMKTQRFSGIVIAGFGDDEFFPSSVQLDTPGFILGKYLTKTHTARVIHPIRNPSHIATYAVDEMGSAFVYGLNNGLCDKIRASSLNTARAFTIELLTGIKDAIGDEALDKVLQGGLIPALLKDTENKINDVLTEIQYTNAMPLFNVLSLLSIDEMAELAESLVSIESLKEKMTSHSQSVGGPIDIAAITKHDGLVWIKRKHYFDLDNNFNYANRLTKGASE